MAIQDYISKRRFEQEKQASYALTDVLDQAPASIKVIGVGSGGCNSVKRMMDHAVPGMTFAMVNTGNIVLESGASDVDIIRMGAVRARVWGAFGGFGVDNHDADEPSQQLRRSIANADLVFITAGMGGGTGTGAAPYVAHLAKEQGATVVGFVTAPFDFEGRRRMGLAVAGVDRLRPYVDNLILIHNDRLLPFFDRDAHMAQAFRKADEVVAQGILDLSGLMNVPQEINVDLEDVRSIMDCRGRSLMAVGRGRGTAGSAEAARQAVANPLLDRGFDSASGALVMIKGGTAGMTLGGVNAARQVVSNAVRKDARIFIGAELIESMGEEVSITLIATGLQHDSPGGPDRPVIT